MYIYIVILIVFSWCQQSVITDDDVCAKDKSSPTSRLKEELLCSYDKTTRPKLQQSNATGVVIRMILKSLSYDMHNQVITVNCWFALIWTDDHLKWKPSEYGGVSMVHISAEEIWTPDISIYNRAEESGNPTSLIEVSCLVMNGGTVICIPPSSHKALCAPDTRRFPFDRQNCTVRFGSWVHSGEEINFKLAPDSISVDDYTENGEWKLIEYNVTKHPGIYEASPNSTYPTLNYNFVLQRHPGMHICSSIAPLFVMMLMTILALCHDPVEKDRFTMILLNIFAHFMYLQYFFWQLPYSGAKPPLILLFCRDSLFLTASALILTTLQKHLIRSKGQSPVWISMIVASVINSKPGQYIFLSDDNVKALANRIGDDDGANIIENSEKQNSKDWIIFSNILDKLCIFSFVIVYFVMIIGFIP